MELALRLQDQPLVVKALSRLGQRSRALLRRQVGHALFLHLFHFKGCLAEGGFVEGSLDPFQRPRLGRRGGIERSVDSTAGRRGCRWGASWLGPQGGLERLRFCVLGAKLQRLSDCPHRARDIFLPVQG